MIFTPTKLPGSFLIDLEPTEDERGFFARSSCVNEFELRGLDGRFVQCNVSFNKKKGTLRGLHYQKFPHEEAKLVRCTAGAIYDVIVDLRPSSATFKKWDAAEITAANHRALYVPKGFAHGFQTLCDDTEVFYQMTEFYAPEAACGYRWDDGAFEICWPEGPRTISSKDQSYLSFSE